MKKLLMIGLFAAAGMVGCVDATTNDPSSPDESFMVDGKADTFSIDDNSPEGVGILALVNESDFERLDIQVGLDRRAAKNIVDHRSANGDITTLAELDGIAYVGKSAFGSLFRFAFSNGYFRLMIHGVQENSAIAEAILDAANTLTKSELDHEVALDRRAANAIVVYRYRKDIESLDELDRISYVGRSAFAKLVDFVGSPLDQEVIDQMLADMADDIGEYFHYDGTEYEGAIKEVRMDSLPGAVDQAAWDEAQWMLDNWELDFPNERYDVEPSVAYSVTYEGEVIGYVVNLEEYIDHPLHDGSGVHLYINLLGEIVSYVSWTG